MTKLILLTKGKDALVDDADYEWLNQWKWCATYTDGKWYAKRSTAKPKKNFSMHRVIMNPPSNMQVDHINGDGLDNRRRNLRVVTHSQNQRNKISYNKWGFKGISKSSRRKSFEARITLDGKKISLGSYPTPEEAARAYDAAAKRIYGPFAHLNFPETAKEYSDQIALMDSDVIGRTA